MRAGKLNGGVRVRLVQVRVVIGHASVQHGDMGVGYPLGQNRSWTFTLAQAWPRTPGLSVALGRRWREIALSRT